MSPGLPPRTVPGMCTGCTAREALPDDPRCAECKAADDRVDAEIGTPEEQADLAYGRPRASFSNFGKRRR